MTNDVGNGTKFDNHIETFSMCLGNLTTPPLECHESNTPLAVQGLKMLTGEICFRISSMWKESLSEWPDSRLPSAVGRADKANVSSKKVPQTVAKGWRE
jgi:hypothetical protein